MICVPVLTKRLNICREHFHEELRFVPPRLRFLHRLRGQLRPEDQQRVRGGRLQVRPQHGAALLQLRLETGQLHRPPAEEHLLLPRQDQEDRLPGRVGARDGWGGRPAVGQQLRGGREEPSL